MHISGSASQLIMQFLKIIEKELSDWSLKSRNFDGEFQTHYTYCIELLLQWDVSAWISYKKLTKVEYCLQDFWSKNDVIRILSKVSTAQAMSNSKPDVCNPKAARNFGILDLKQCKVCGKSCHLTFMVESWDYISFWIRWRPSQKTPLIMSMIVVKHSTKFYRAKTTHSFFMYGFLSTTTGKIFRTFFWIYFSWGLVLFYN